MKYSLALVFAFMTTAQAATVAVIDSGVDYLHQQLAHKMWLNPIIEYRGDFPRAINGWNFVENNNLIFDHSLMEKFPTDIFGYYEVEARFNAGTLTAEDRKYIQEKLSDENFVTKVQEYGSYAHGTHVSGIAAKNADHEIIGIKYIQANVSSILKLLKSMKTNLSEEQKYHFYLSYIAKNQGENFKKMAKFLEKHVADVANGSFGAPFKQIQRISDSVYKEIYKKEPDDTESFKGAYFLQSYILESYKESVAKTKNTLYVFASGNDGLNNDIYPFSPANLNQSNTITVAATQGSRALAKFSNYGEKTVDVAAPGVNIYSAAPGTNNIPMSGTSQAAPFVSKVAGKIKDINPKLTPADVKKILMETVDKKAFLKGKVKSGGMVNEKRALRAAELSLRTNLRRAIYEANVEITQSTKSLIGLESTPMEKLRFVEMPSIFIE